jgi:transposase
MTTSGEGLGGTGARRRRWTEEEKARIVAECEAPGCSVSMVARRHDLNGNMLFTWRRQFRERRCGAGRVSFVPAVIATSEPAADRSAVMPREAQPGLASSSAPRPTGRIEIVLGDSRWVIVDADVSAAALARVIGVLERR